MAAATAGRSAARGWPLICSACAFDNSESARFCGGCGVQLDFAAQRAAGERRQITVLTCDVVGSTALSQALDPEELHEMLADFQRVCQETTERYDGYISQFLGDGVQIYFGFPRAHEDDARRAVSCGLEILQGTEQLNQAAARPSGARLRIRVGADTGRVVVSPVGTGARRENIAMGDAPNIASRVQALAEPDTLWVTEATWRIAHEHFQGEPRGEFELKGLSSAVRLWRVTRAGGVVPGLERVDLLTLYVGRGQEHALLAAHWTAARAGSARFVTVRGEPGIGKSRLVAEFRGQAATADTTVLAARCTQFAKNSAFLPVTELLERVLGLDGVTEASERLDRMDEQLAALGIGGSDAAPLIAALLSIPVDGRYPPLELSPTRSRVRTIETLVAVIEAIAARNATILVAEDLHWADPSTLEVLDLLVARARRLRLLGLFTARPEFQSAWSDDEATPLVDVSRLDHAEVEAVVRHVAHGKPVPGDLIREIIHRCDGVPLFIEEVARAVIEAGVLQENEYSWALTGALPLDLIPASVDASLMARIDRLGDARGTAQLAATIGREFSYAQLRAVSERSETELRADLERILAAGLAWQVSAAMPTTFVFKHALVQMAAYESLLRSTRQRFHERIARVLLSDFEGEVALRPEIVARHLSGAGNHAEASDHWFAAGQRALTRMAVPEAHGHFTRALDGLAKLPTSDDVLGKELDLQIAIAPTLMTLYGWASPMVADACERASSLCHQLGQPDKLYSPVWGLWTNLFVGGQLDRALETANEALSMAVASGVPMLEVTGRHAVAYTHYYRGEWAECIDHAQAGIALYELAQERLLTNTFQLSSTVNMVAGLASSLWMMGHQDLGLAELDHVIQMARDLDHPSALSNALGVACYMLTFHHDPSRMLGYASEVKSFARAEGWELWYAVGVMSSGWARLRLGDRGDGLKELFEGVALFRATRSDLMGPTVAVIHAEGLRAAGRNAEALEMLVETAETARRGHVGVLLPDVYRLIGEIHLQAGALQESHAAFDMGFETARAQRALSLELRMAVSCHALLERTGRAAEGLAQVRQCYERFTDSFDQPELRAARALLEGAGR